MKANFVGDVWYIPTPRTFTADELYDLMKSKGNFEGVFS